jgi:hypothetical protein
MGHTVLDRWSHRHVNLGASSKVTQFQQYFNYKRYYTNGLMSSFVCLLQVPSLLILTVILYIRLSYYIKHKNHTSNL